MKYFKIVLWYMLVTYLVGCSTPYKSHGIMGGHEDSYLGNDIYQIYYRGNAYTNIHKVNAYSIRRAAELCLSKGKKYFEVLNSQNLTNTYTTNLPTTYTTTGTYTLGIFNATTRQTGGETLSYTKPAILITVKLLNVKTSTSYNAAEILAHLPN